MILAEDASQNTKDKFENLTAETGLGLVFFGEKDVLSKSVGKENKAVFAVTDKGFADKIIELIKESKGAI